MRISHYHARSIYADGSVHAKDYPFTEGHAARVGDCLFDGGLEYGSALRLIDQWNREGKGRYQYSIRMEDQLAMLDQKAGVKKY